MNGQTATALTNLLYADRALLGMYDEASSRLSEGTVDVLRGAVEDHHRHESFLAEALEAAEMQVVEVSEDLGLLMEEHRHRVRSARDESEVLEVLTLAERLNAVLYEAAEREDLPEELSELLAEHHADERMHVSLLAERAPQVAGHREHEIACMTGGLTDDRNPDDFE
jgi:hypothetical protein